METEKILTQRQDLEKRLMAESEKRFSTYRKISYGFTGGLWIIALTLDVNARTIGNLSTTLILLLFIGYKLYSRSESKKNRALVESEYPLKSH
jgi:hypothetical protein